MNLELTHTLHVRNTLYYDDTTATVRSQELSRLSSMIQNMTYTVFINVIYSF